MRLLGLVVVLLALAAAAHAADAPPGAVQLAPNVAGSASELRVELGADSLAQSNPNEQARALSLFGARGLKVDTRAVETRCSDARADAFTCPEESRIGRGEAHGHAAGIVQDATFEFTASIDVFLTDRRKKGDIAGVVVQISEPQSGQRFNAKGRIARTASRRFGTEVRFEDLNGAGQLPTGVTVMLDRVELRVGAERTLRRRGNRSSRGGRRIIRVPVSLLTNPATCRRSWPYRVNIEYADRTDTYDGTVACRKR